MLCVLALTACFNGSGGVKYLASGPIDPITHNGIPGWFVPDREYSELLSCCEGQLDGE